jgi:hypothetical protein
MGVQLLTAVFGFAPSVAIGLAGAGSDTGAGAGATAAGAAAGALAGSAAGAGCEPSFSLMISVCF